MESMFLRSGGAKLEQGGSKGSLLGTMWRLFGLIWASLWAFLVHFWALFFRVRFQGRFLGKSGRFFGLVSAVVRLSGGCRALSGCPGASGSGALGGGGDSFGDPFSGLSEGNSIRLAASFGTGAADLRASPPAAGPHLHPEASGRHPGGI